MANQKPWGFIQNPFLIATEGSYRLAVRISLYHFAAISKMAGDPFFDALIASFSPLNTALQDAYNTWKAKGGTQQGQTLQLKQLLSLLSSTKIKGWDIAIQNVFSDTTAEYKALLPNHRGPFQLGSQDDRIAAVARDQAA